jgi:hypothetical protein
MHKNRREWYRLCLFFLERYNKDNDEFLSYIVQVTGDETWVPVVSVETNEQSQQCKQTLSPNKPKKFKHILSRCQEDDDNCFMGQETRFDSGIYHQEDTIRSELYCMRNTKRTTEVRLFRTNGVAC